jgi:hypothetical protein
MKRDGIRIFAWIVIAAGGFMVLGGLVWYVFADNVFIDVLDARAFATCVYPYMKRDCHMASPWPAISIGAVMAAFGVLLLAIRRPATL